MSAGSPTSIVPACELGRRLHGFAALGDRQDRQHCSLISVRANETLFSEEEGGLNEECTQGGFQPGGRSGEWVLGVTAGARLWIDS
jgi:hypothetical protein